MVDEINYCLAKIAKREGVPPVAVKNFLKDGRTFLLRPEYEWLKETLDKVYRAYHQAQKEKLANSVELEKLSGIEFENWISKFLKENGFTDIRGTPATGDQGADLIANKDEKKIIIQAKRYQGAVGNKAVQELIAAVQFYRGDEGWVITNSTFTEAAKNLAHRSNVKLIDGKMLENFERHVNNDRSEKGIGNPHDVFFSTVNFSEPDPLLAPVTDAVAALVNLGYGQAQAAAAIAAAARSAGEGAEATTLIRLGLRELAK